MERLKKDVLFVFVAPKLPNWKEITITLANDWHHNNCRRGPFTLQVLGGLDPLSLGSWSL